MAETPRVKYTEVIRGGRPDETVEDRKARIESVAISCLMALDGCGPNERKYKIIKKNGLKFAEGASFHHDVAGKLVAIVKSFDKNFDTVVDLACGCGDLMFPVLKAGVAKTGIGFVTSGRAVDFARTNAILNESLDRASFRLEGFDHDMGKIPNGETLFIGDFSSLDGINSALQAAKPGDAIVVFCYFKVYSGVDGEAEIRRRWSDREIQKVAGCSLKIELVDKDDDVSRGGRRLCSVVMRFLTKAERIAMETAKKATEAAAADVVTPTSATAPVKMRMNWGGQRAVVKKDDSVKSAVKSVVVKDEVDTKPFKRDSGFKSMEVRDDVMRLMGKKLT